MAVQIFFFGSFFTVSHSKSNLPVYRQTSTDHSDCHWAVFLDYNELSWNLDPKCFHSCNRFTCMLSPTALGIRMDALIFKNLGHDVIWTIFLAWKSEPMWPSTIARRVTCIYMYIVHVHLTTSMIAPQAICNMDFFSCVLQLASFSCHSSCATYMYTPKQVIDELDS